MCIEKDAMMDRQKERRSRELCAERGDGGKDVGDC